jgi:hypothetical protein
MYNNLIIQEFASRTTLFYVISHSNPLGPSFFLQLEPRQDRQPASSHVTISAADIPAYKPLPRSLRRKKNVNSTVLQLQDLIMFSFATVTDWEVNIPSGLFAWQPVRARS